MASSHKHMATKAKSDFNVELPVCPITNEVPEDPVIDSEGHTFEKKDIERWLENKNTCPLNPNHKITKESLHPNYALRNLFPAVKVLQAQLADLQRKLAEKTQTCDQYETLLISKNSAKNETKNQPLDRQQAFLIEKISTFAQRIANLEYEQHSYIGTRALLANAINKRMIKLHHSHKTIKQNKARALSQGSAIQADLKKLIIEYVQKFQPGSKENPIPTLQDYSAKLDRAIKQSLEDVETLRQQYNQDVVATLLILQKRLRTWFTLSQSIQLIAEQLKSLRELQADAARQLDIQTRGTTSTLFEKLGGTKKSPTASKPSKPSKKSGKDEEKAMDSSLSVTQLNELKSRFTALALSCQSVYHRSKTVTELVAIFQIAEHDSNFKDFLKTQVEQLNVDSGQWFFEPLIEAIGMFSAGMSVDLLCPNAVPILIHLLRNRSEGGFNQTINLLGAKIIPVLNLTNSEGDTLLHWAAYKNHASTVELLIKLGADPTLKNRSGRTPREEVKLGVFPANQALINYLMRAELDYLKQPSAPLQQSLPLGNRPR